ncbi:MAG TPA: serine/threonine-protein kinase [Anaerolineales bacterium]|nr:serine/threonine-protein kinase [Anaerolineales bacterium]
MALSSQELDVQIGPYRIANLIGRGSMSDVFRGIHTLTGQPAAVKIMFPHLAHNLDVVHRFEREVEAMRRLDHPAISRLFGTYEHDGRRCLALEFLAGGTLEEHLKAAREDDGRMSVGHVLTWLAPIADALDVAHKLGVVHRDLKPANILFRSGDLASAVLTDFGLAQVSDSSRLSHYGGLVGTPAYISPEQARGLDCDGRSDIYALTAIVYEALVGQPPFGGATMSVVMKHISEPPPLPRALGVDLPAAVEQVLLKGLAKEPGDRYPTASLFLRALRAAADQRDPAGQTETTVPVSAQSGAARGEATSTPRRLWVGSRTASSSGAQSVEAPSPSDEPSGRTKLLALSGLAVVLAVLVWWAWTEFSKPPEMPASAPRFSVGSNVIVSVPNEASTSVTRGCPGVVWTGVLGLATDGQRTRVLDRQVCSGNWWYLVRISERATEDWDGTGWIDGRFLRSR